MKLLPGSWSDERPFARDADEDYRLEPFEMPLPDCTLPADEENLQRLIDAAACPHCGARAGLACFPGTNEPHFDRRFAYSRVILSTPAEHVDA